MSVTIDALLDNRRKLAVEAWSRLSEAPDVHQSQTRPPARFKYATGFATFVACKDYMNGWKSYILISMERTLLNSVFQ